MVTNQYGSGCTNLMCACCSFTFVNVRFDHTYACVNQTDHKIQKIAQFFLNVAKTVANISKLKLKVTQ
jgi:hypothetical protein